MSFGGFSNWIRTFESKIDEALDIKPENEDPKKPSTSTAASGGKSTQDSSSSSGKHNQNGIGPSSGDDTNNSSSNTKSDSSPTAATTQDHDDNTQKKNDTGNRVGEEGTMQEETTRQLTTASEQESSTELTLETMKLLENLLGEMNAKGLSSSLSTKVNDTEAAHTQQSGTQMEDANQGDASSQQQQQDIIRGTVESILHRVALKHSNDTSQSHLTTTTPSAAAASQSSLTIQQQQLNDFTRIFHKLHSQLSDTLLQKDTSIRNLSHKYQQLTTKYQHIRNVADSNSEGIALKEQFESLKKEFSLRLGREEQRNSKLAKENTKLRKEHASYEERLTTLTAKENQIKQLNATNKDLTSTQSSLEKKLSQFKKKNATLDSQVASLEKQLTNLQSELKSTKEENTEYTTIVDQMRNFLIKEEQESESTTEKDSEQHQQDETKFSPKDATNMQLAQHIVQKLKNSAEASLNKASQERLQTQIAQLEKQHESKLSSLKSSFEQQKLNMRQQMQQLERSLVQVTNEKNDREAMLKEEITSLREQRISAEKEVEKLLTEQLPETTNGLHEEIRLLSQKSIKDQESWNAERKRLENRIRYLENQVKLIQVEHESVKKDYTNQKTQLRNMQDQLDKAQELNHSRRQQITTLEEKIQQQSKSIKEYTTRVSSLKGEISKLRQQCQQLSSNQWTTQQVAGTSDGNSIVEEYNRREELEPLSPPRSMSSTPLLGEGTEEEWNFDETESTSTFGATSSVNGTRMEYAQLQSRLRKQNEYLSVMKQKIDRLEETRDKLREKLVSQEQEYEQRVEERDQMKKEHETAMILLGEKQTQVGELTQDLNHVKSMFRTQICSLLDEIEKLKAEKR